MAVGSAAGPRSNVWRGGSSGNEVYLMHSNMGKVQKFSFHKSLKCRLAYHEHTKPATIDDRAIEKWERLPTPSAGISYALVAIIPTDTLSTVLAEEKKEVLWVEAASVGRTTVLEFVFSREDYETTSARAGDSLRQILSYSKLPNGEAFVVTRTTGEWTGEDFVAPGLINDDKQYVVSREDPENTGRPGRLSMYVHHEVGFLQVFEYGAYQVPLDAKFSKPMGRLTRTKLVDRTLGDRRRSSSS
jgi:hypothetical protein